MYNQKLSALHLEVQLQEIFGSLVFRESNFPWVLILILKQFFLSVQLFPDIFSGLYTLDVIQNLELGLKGQGHEI